MNVVLWGAQVLVALVFVVSGAMKAVGSKQWLLASGQTGLAPFGVPFIRFVAISELLGAAGLIAPDLTGIARILTPMAAACLGVLMVGAAGVHGKLARENQANAARRGKELLNVATNIVLLLLCLLVVVGRGLETI
jgi:uncharacterized membrane protein YphA (DoxX/SURF4 family)